MKHRWHINEKLAKAIACFMVIGGIVAPVASSMAASQPRDNDANAVMWGGAYSKSEFVGNLNKGDGHHSSANLKQIYLNEGRGITASAFNSASTVDGEVTSDGRVIVHNQTVSINGQRVTVDGTVANHAVSGGRNFIAGSWKEGSLWMRPTSVSFKSSSIPAWVDMSGGQFHFAIIKSCGNPAEAQATKVFKPAPVKTVTPAPATVQHVTPQPTEEPVQTQPVVTSEQVLCSTMDKTFVKDNIWQFRIFQQPDGASVAGYLWTFNDGTQVTPTSANTIQHPVGPKGVTVFGQVKRVDGSFSPITTNCSQAVQGVEAPATTTVPTVVPTATGQVLSATAPTPLPATGPEAALGGVAGITGIAVASRAYIRSRKSLLGRMRDTK
jgi:hypothetical protein